MNGTESQDFIQSSTPNSREKSFDYSPALLQATQALTNACIIVPAVCFLGATIVIVFGVTLCKIYKNGGKFPTPKSRLRNCTANCLQMRPNAGDRQMHMNSPEYGASTAARGVAGVNVRPLYDASEPLSNTRQFACACQNVPRHECCDGPGLPNMRLFCSGDINCERMRNVKSECMEFLDAESGNYPSTYSSTSRVVRCGSRSSSLSLSSYHIQPRSFPVQIDPVGILHAMDQQVAFNFQDSRNHPTSRHTWTKSQVTVDNFDMNRLSPMSSFRRPGEGLPFASTQINPIEREGRSTTSWTTETFEPRDESLEWDNYQSPLVSNFGNHVASSPQTWASVNLAVEGLSYFDFQHSRAFRDFEKYKQTSILLAMGGGMIVVLAVCVIQHFLYQEDPTLGIVGTTALMAVNMGKSVSTVTSAYYSALSIGPFSGLAAVAARSRYSKLASPEEYGKLFLFLSISENSSTFTGYLVYVKLHEYVRDVILHIPYLITAWLLVFPLSIFVWQLSLLNDKEFVALPSPNTPPSETEQCGRLRF